MMSLDFEYLSMYREETIPKDLLDSTPKHLNGGYWKFFGGPSLIEWKESGGLRVYRFRWGVFDISIEFICTNDKKYLVNRMYVHPPFDMYTVVEVKKEWLFKLELMQIFGLFNENVNHKPNLDEFWSIILESGYFYISEVEQVIAELGDGVLQVGV
jgi:hypothetical protein